MALSMVWVVFGTVLLALGLLRRNPVLRWTGMGLFAQTVAKVLLIDPKLSAVTYRLLANPHALPLLVIALMVYIASYWYARNAEHVRTGEVGIAGALPVVASILLWWVLTSEAWHFVGLELKAGADARQYALTAVWTLYGAMIIAAGLLFRNPALRWTAMTLFAMTIVKVFAFDMAGLLMVYRILALGGLGGVLILVGFGYQRLVREQTPHAPIGGGP